MEVGSGDLVLLAGPSGGGKTTAALGLAGLLGEPVDGTVEGSVCLGDQTLAGDGAGRILGKVGLVQQDPEAHLCTLTVTDEVAFGPENLALPKDEVIERLEASLSAVGIGHLRDRGTNQLSGGEKQRVAIASMLAMDPEVLVLDEPTANLDPWSREEVLSLMVRLAGEGDRAVVVSEHRLDVLAEAAREIIILDGGVPSWRGSPTDLQEEAEDIASIGVRVPGRPGLIGIHRPPSKVGDPVLSVSDLVSGYGEREVLRGVDLELRGGEMVGLVGPNGGGKTTLLRCLLGLADVWEGRIVVTGLDATTEHTSTLARRAGMVFQTPDHQLFERTVREEMEFGPRNFGTLDDPMHARIDALSSDYGLSDLMEVHPFRLSLGQKRRLNVASVQTMSPKLLMLDEPFIGQDLGSIRALNARLQEARAQGTGILLVSHDLEVLAQMVDRVVVLEKGTCHEVEDPASLAEGIPWGVAG